jgi:hypothetical protein
MSSSIITSPHLLVKINSIPFGRVASLDWTVNSPTREINTIDLLEPAEITNIHLSISGRISIYRLLRDGGAEAAGMIGTWNSMTLGKYFSVSVTDRRIDNVIFQVAKCVVSSQSWSASAKGTVMGLITFTGFQYVNDSQDLEQG